MAQSLEDADVDLTVALAATRSNNHVHLGQEFGIALSARAVERQTGGVNADALPGFHLALVAALWNLLVEIERGSAVDDVWRI